MKKGQECVNELNWLLTGRVVLHFLEVLYFVKTENSGSHFLFPFLFVFMNNRVLIPFDLAGDMIISVI